MKDIFFMVADQIYELMKKKQFLKCLNLLYKMDTPRS